MRMSLTRILAVPAVALGVAAGVAVVAPAAFAQTDSGGTVALTVPFSFVAQLAKAGVVSFPTPFSEVSVNKTAQTVTVTFKVTGGDADASDFTGQVNLSGSLNAVDINGHAVSVSGLDLNLVNGDIEGTPKGSSTPVGLLDLGGNITFSAPVGGTTQTLNADGMTIDPAGAAYVNSALHNSKALVANETVGTLAASWGFAE